MIVYPHLLKATDPAKKMSIDFLFSMPIFVLTTASGEAVVYFFYKC